MIVALMKQKLGFVHRMDVGLKHNLQQMQFKKNKWYFLVSRYNGTDLSLWINDKQVAETAASGNLLAQGSGNYAYIGSRGDGGSFFNGSIADAQIYNVALSSAQIQDLYLNNTVSGIGIYIVVGAMIASLFSSIG